MNEPKNSNGSLYWKIARTTVSALSFFFLMTSVYIMKPTRSPLINQSIGSDKLQYFYAANALISLYAVIWYNHLVSRYPRTQLLRIVFGIILVCLLLLCIFFGLHLSPNKLGGQILAGVHFFFVSTYIVFGVAMFWSFNHDIHNPQEAERCYPYINFGAQIGVIVGSQITSFWSMKHLDKLFVISALAILVCWALLEWLKRFDRQLDQNRYAKPIATGTIRDVKLFFANRYVLCIGLIVLLATFSPTLGDLQYNWTLDNTLLSNLKAPTFHWDDFKNLRGLANKLAHYVRPISSLDHYPRLTFSSDDFKNVSGLADKLRQPKTSLDHYLRRELSPDTRKLIDQNPKGMEKIQQALLADFNRILQQGPLFDVERFDSIKLSEKRQRQMQLNLQGEEQILFNRALLEDVYCNEIHNSQIQLQTKFRATVNVKMGILSLFMCLIITPLLFWLLGPMVAICLYPLVLFTGAVLFIKGASIYAIGDFVWISMALNYSLYKVGKEVLLVPTDKNIKFKINAFCETFLFRLGDMLASLAMVIYIVIFGKAWIFGMSYLLLLAVVIWIPILLYMGRQYRAITGANLKQA